MVVIFCHTDFIIQIYILEIPDKLKSCGENLRSFFVLRCMMKKYKVFMKGRMNANGTWIRFIRLVIISLSYRWCWIILGLFCFVLLKGFFLMWVILLFINTLACLIVICFFHSNLLQFVFKKIIFYNQY